MIKKIKKALDDRPSIVEKTTTKGSLTQGAKVLLNDYQTDKKLTTFTALDAEDFYEVKADQ
jgi:hypothetical protein